MVRVGEALSDARTWRCFHRMISLYFFTVSEADVPLPIIILLQQRVPVVSQSKLARLLPLCASDVPPVHAAQPPFSARSRAPRVPPQPATRHQHSTSPARGSPAPSIRRCGYYLLRLVTKRVLGAVSTAGPPARRPRPGTRSCAPAEYEYEFEYAVLFLRLTALSVVSTMTWLLQLASMVVSRTEPAPSRAGAKAQGRRRRGKRKTSAWIDESHVNKNIVFLQNVLVLLFWYSYSDLTFFTNE